MKQGQSLTAIAVELERQRESRRDYVAQTTALTFDADARLTGINGPLALRPHAHAQVASELSIPKPYYDRLRIQAPALLAANVNHWLHAEPKRRLVRTLDGEVRAFLSDRYRPLDNWDLAEMALPVFNALGLQVVSSALTELRLYFKVVLPTLSATVPGSRRVGDIVRAGLVIQNSEVGASAVRVEPMVDFLACLNGAIMSDASLRRYHVGKLAATETAVNELLSDEARRASDKAFWLSVRDVVRGAFERDVFLRVVARLGEAVADKIESKVEQVVEVTAKRFGLTQEVGQSVLRHLIEGGDLSRYGLSNAVTRASQDVEDYEEATSMERAGGQIIELPRSDWRALAAGREVEPAVTKSAA